MRKTDFLRQGLLANPVVEHVELEWLHSDGDIYYDMGIKAGGDYTFSVEVWPDELEEQVTINGICGAIGDSGSLGLYTQANELKIDTRSSSLNITEYSNGLSSITVATVDGELYTTVDGMTYTTVPLYTSDEMLLETNDGITIILDKQKVEYDPTPSDINFLLLAQNTIMGAENNFKGKVGKFNIATSEKESAVVPVKILSNNTICLFDKISKTYVYHQGTGTPTGGPELDINHTRLMWVKKNSKYQFVDIDYVIQPEDEIEISGLIAGYGKSNYFGSRLNITTDDGFVVSTDGISNDISFSIDGQVLPLNTKVNQWMKIVLRDNNIYCNDEFIGVIPASYPGSLTTSYLGALRRELLVDGDYEYGLIGDCIIKDRVNIIPVIRHPSNEVCFYDRLLKKYRQSLYPGTLDPGPVYGSYEEFIDHLIINSTHPLQGFLSSFSYSEVSKIEMELMCPGDTNINLMSSVVDNIVGNNVGSENIVITDIGSVNSANIPIVEYTLPTRAELANNFQVISITFGESTNTEKIWFLSHPDKNITNPEIHIREITIYGRENQILSFMHCEHMGSFAYFKDTVNNMMYYQHWPYNGGFLIP